jgi:hypothetical protein
VPLRTSSTKSACGDNIVYESSTLEAIDSQLLARVIGKFPGPNPVVNVLQVVAITPGRPQSHRQDWDEGKVRRTARRVKQTKSPPRTVGFRGM